MINNPHYSFRIMNNMAVTQNVVEVIIEANDFF